MENEIEKRLNNLSKMLLRPDPFRWFRSFFTGISNLIRWFPIIWRDRQFDHGYLFDMLRRKLVLMDEFWQSGDTVSVKQPRVMKDIHTARLLADRLCDMDYIKNAMTGIDEKYGEMKIAYEKSKECPHYTVMKFIETEDGRRARAKAFNLSEYLRKQDQEMLFGMMAKKD